MQSVVPADNIDWFVNYSDAKIIAKPRRLLQRGVKQLMYSVCTTTYYGTPY